MEVDCGTMQDLLLLNDYPSSQVLYSGVILPRSFQTSHFVPRLSSSVLNGLAHK